MLEAGGPELLEHAAHLGRRGGGLRGELRAGERRLDRRRRPPARRQGELEGHDRGADAVVEVAAEPAALGGARAVAVPGGRRRRGRERRRPGDEAPLDAPARRRRGHERDAAHEQRDAEADPRLERRRERHEQAAVHRADGEEYGEPGHAPSVSRAARREDEPGAAGCRCHARRSQG